MIENNFWNSRLKAETLQKFWDHQNNLVEQLKVRTIFGNRMFFFNLFPEVSQKLEQLEFKLRFFVGFRIIQEKLEKDSNYFIDVLFDSLF